MTRAFIDSSVFIAAVRSPTGGSGEVLRFAAIELFEAVISDDVVEEVQRYFHKKFPMLLPAMKMGFSDCAFSFCQPHCGRVDAGSDLHAGKVDFLVTLDQSVHIEAHVSYKIVRPEVLLEQLRRRN